MRPMAPKVIPPPWFRRLSLIGVALLAMVGCAGHATEGELTAESNLDLPQQTLLSSMREQPVPGWTITVDELGLPPGTVVRPVGNIGDRGTFLGITDEG